MKLCKTCSAPMEDDATFCPMCGAKNENNNVSEETTVLNQNNVPAYVNVPPQPEPPKQKKKLSKGVIAIIIVAAILVLSVIGIFVVKAVQDSQYSDDLDYSNDSIESYDSNDIGSDDYSDVSTLEFGTIENYSYSNDFAGLHIDLPSDEWVFLTPDEIVSEYLPNGNIDTENNKLYLENDLQRVYIDMLMKNTANNYNIQVQLIPTNGDNTYSSKDMFDAMLDQVETQYSALGYTVTGINEFDDTSIIGLNDYYVASIEMEVSEGVKTGQLYAVSKVNEETFVVIIVSGLNDNNELFELLNMFY